VVTGRVVDVVAGVVVVAVVDGTVVPDEVVGEPVECPELLQPASRVAAIAIATAT